MATKINSIGQFAHALHAFSHCDQSRLLENSFPSRSSQIPNFSNNFQLGVAFKNMPPCQKVLMNKMKRMLSVTRMIKSAGKTSVHVPEAVDGYCTKENGNFSIEYYSGLPYPENICDLINDKNNSVMTITKKMNLSVI